MFDKRASAIGSNNVLLALLKTAHLPARLVTGVNLQVAAAEQPFYWVEVYDAETWIPLDPVYGYLRNLPVFYIPVRKMAIVMSGFIYFNPGVDSIVVLLPVVVLTMLVDRIYSIADQRGIRTALIRLFWTVVAATVSLLVLLQADWSIWLVAYPEIHVVTLASIIIIGLYHGPKLSDVPVLNWLHEPKIKIISRTDKADQSGQSGDSV